MELNDLYQLLSMSYNRIDPHHETWMLWLKKKSEEELFEVAIGTILVQNTNWINVDLAISNLFKHNIASFKRLKAVKTAQLEVLIRPTGFYKQKARSLYSLAEIFLDYFKGSKTPSRNALLRIKGVGKETADSLLVYCFYEAVPIVGTYTRRFFARMFGKVNYLKDKYENIQEFISNSLDGDCYVLGKFHALIVSHCQQLCQKILPLCEQCPLKRQCTYGQYHHTQPNIMQIQNAINKPKSGKLI